MIQTKFISEVLKGNGTIGALSPSSAFLAKKMLAPICFDKAKCIVEFGPGTGVFTRKLLKKMQPNAKLLIFEINESFLTELRKISDPRLLVINDSAENLEIYLKQNQLDNADYILSSLPLAVIPEKVVNTILLNSKKTLCDKGKFIQFQYSLNAKAKIKSVFSKVKITFTLLNLPPAVVYICEK